MNKKYICGILTAAVLFGTFPVSAYADDSLKLIRSIDLREQTADMRGGGWAWDADSQILTLKDFRVTVPHGKLEERAAIYLPDESTIELEGENELTTESYHCDAIYAEGELYVTGDGTLKITTESLSSSAFFVKHGPLVFEDDVEVTVDPEGYVIYIDEAKGLRPVLSVENNAKVIFPQESTERNIMVTHKSSTRPQDNWLNYEEEFDNDTETVIMVKKHVATAPPAEEIPVDEDKNTYQITIGKPEILKNGELSYTADVTPYLSNGYTMLPLRALLEVSNPEQKVMWNNGTKSAHTFVNDRLISIKPGETTYTKALESIELCTPAETVNGRLFVSLRDWMSIMEIDSMQLKWNPETKTALLIY